MGLFTNLLRREEAVFAPELEYAAWIFARLGSWPSACTFDYAFLPSITGFPAWLRRLYAFPACFLGDSNPETFYLDSRYRYAFDDYSFNEYLLFGKLGSDELFPHPKASECTKLSRNSE